MLTVKHTHTNGDTIYSGVKQVNWTPRACEGSVALPESPGVRFDYDGMQIHLGGGHVFVMNENGRTVEQYHF
jgi:hypothetical protein